ncbi:MAG TPA: hypothetical protein VLN57_20895 [Xanthobacteraceae bacterium]|nr:hypothetical protein [Xanthobacteraceae bacterium]
MSDSDKTRHPIVCRGVDITEHVGQLFSVAADMWEMGALDQAETEAAISIAALVGWERSTDDVATDPPGYPEGSPAESGPAREKWLADRKAVIAAWIADVKERALREVKS